MDPKDVPITFRNLAAALETARVKVWDDARAKGDTERPLGAREISDMIDGFVASVVESLDPEGQ